VCTLIVAVGAFADAALLVAANRDERLDRPSEPPALRPVGPIPVVAPLDVQAGGTWLGLNAAGLFAGITNRFGAPPDPALPSRGQLVFEALEQTTPAAAARRLADRDPAGLNRFHLLLADRTDAWCVFHDGLSLHAETLGPGIHVLTERSRGAASGGREAWLAERMAGWSGKAAPRETALMELLAFHHPDDPFDGTCVHADWLGYGTRSTTLLKLGVEGGGDRLLYADGPPCRTALQDRTELLEGLV